MYCLSTQTFFSTNIISYQSGGSDASNPGASEVTYSSLAMTRWLEVTLPLMAVTLLIAWVIYEMEQRQVSLRTYLKGWFVRRSQSSNVQP